MWLLEDITGLCSRREYGKRGDEVTVLDKSRPMWLVELREKFFVHPEKLSSVRVTNPDIDKKPLREPGVVRSKANPVQRKRNTGSALSAAKQGGLY